jgi:hypothetical protein
MLWNSTCSLILMMAASLGLAALVSRTPLRKSLRNTWRLLVLFPLGLACGAGLLLIGELVHLQTTIIHYGRALLLMGSLLALAQSGRRLLIDRYTVLRRREVGLLLWSMASLCLVPSSPDSMSRMAWLVLGIPGSLMTASGLWRSEAVRWPAGRRAMGAGLLALVAWAVAEALAQPFLASVAATITLIGVWISLRSRYFQDAAGTPALGTKLAVAYALLVALACWWGSGSPATIVRPGSGALAMTRGMQSWESATVQRWRAALPIFATMLLLPAAGAALYWLGAEKQRSPRPRVRS